MGSRDVLERLGILRVARALGDECLEDSVGLGEMLRPEEHEGLALKSVVVIRRCLQHLVVAQQRFLIASGRRQRLSQALSPVPVVRVDFEKLSKNLNSLGRTARARKRRSQIVHRSFRLGI